MILIPFRGRRRAPIGVALAVVLALAGASCDTGGSAGAAGRLRVVASFFPVFEAAQRVGDDRVDVVNLTPAGAEPHDLELTTRDLETIHTAGLMLYFDRGFQPALEEAIEGRPGPSVDLLRDLELMAAKDADGPDPHVWLDPILMKEITTRTERAISSIDPQGAATYQTNAAAYMKELDGLHQEFTDGLQQCATRVLVTSHAAFGYLADRYGLRQEPIAGVSPEGEPNPERLAELAALVRREKVTTIFTETLVSPRVAEALAREAGVKTAVLDPLEGIPPEQIEAGVGYVDVMRRNLAALRAGLGCA
jgi:zinc transport system substrate-binding protein